MATDREFLCWLHERLQHQHHESPLIDYMHKLRAIIQDTPIDRCSINMGAYNSLEELQKLLAGRDDKPMPTDDRMRVCIDLVIFRGDLLTPELLMVKRGEEPFKGQWCIPGGHISSDTWQPDGEAEAILLRETDVVAPGGPQLILAKVDPCNDPRGPFISLIYAGWCRSSVVAKAGGNESEVGWFELPGLASSCVGDFGVIAEWVHTQFQGRVIGGGLFR